MRKEDHLAIDEMVFGKAYPEVHRWLDSDFVNWAGGKESLFNHWLKYHHIDAILKKYDNDKYPVEFAVACLHVICDWMCSFGCFGLPINEDALRRMLEKRGVKLWK